MFHTIIPQILIISFAFMACLDKNAVNITDKRNVMDLWRTETVLTEETYSNVLVNEIGNH